MSCWIQYKVSLVNIRITRSAQQQIQQAITWKSTTLGEDGARELIRGTLTDWSNQLQLMPDCGHQCRYLETAHHRELIKGEYRFIYELKHNEEVTHVHLLIFCHTKMDFQTLLRQVVDI
ncbi:hypothetical protein CWB96_00305 [Pseudoalteromonas citrea]|uniref:Type II toxin-antitoxin system RelE/ParE family toxin n=1 Tax=Pseudoalteromonas citrea TaxID=43655 RepID=A0A5S3XVH7_9GAMM|nr:hypothetical protein CWB97_02300 [Pseudoalteromonas citrea]TMP63084.1 hypothetical protein CWB96_00305 [Pseudoalteromonas citrea]